MLDLSAFFFCQELKEIIIPNSVTTIGNATFNYCKNLMTINFKGTVAQWNAVEKGNNWHYNVPATKVVCLDGEVSL